MDNAEFADVLIKSMPYYRSYAIGIKNKDHPKTRNCMCFAINKYYGRYFWSKKGERAKNKIADILHPCAYLYDNFIEKGYIRYDVEIRETEYQRKALAFWTDLILEGKNPNLDMQKLLWSYIRHDDIEGWELTKKLLNHYVK
ncbi:hypothetical protein [Candidatus Macondimonas diazotrophica]|jgi:hypothetical protein|uniref:Uncharacterized protein n=1 Tax=Candidatus Macondimonas diazotrophica TaxID=2305248 RepID=A0A4Z0F8S3_9GAMM|nr:hypothetical protein [Candidatus Macondimonas diazotrophica]TFZ81683.1 hypothetical protein E4680_11475 [Candidatus Macondimonas diazotrophica]